MIGEGVRANGGRGEAARIRMAVGLVREEEEEEEEEEDLPPAPNLSRAVPAMDWKVLRYVLRYKSPVKTGELSRLYSSHGCFLLLVHGVARRCWCQQVRGGLVLLGQGSSSRVVLLAPRSSFQRA